MWKGTNPKIVYSWLLPLLNKLPPLSSRGYVAFQLYRQYIYSHFVVSANSCLPDTFQSPDRNGNPSSTASSADPDWAITVEQFLASALTGQAIVDFFTKRANLIESMATLKNRRFNRVHSLSDTPALNG